MEAEKQPPRLSLCVIAGNEAEYIERLLASFEPAFDELSLVIALGNQVPDHTSGMAQTWCHEHGKAFLLSIYRNDPAHPWPHVDDFAAARNQAFAQATGDWLFWADCDDVASPDIGDLRGIAATATADMYRMPYEVPAVGKITMRERLIRREAFAAGCRWHYPVHENLLITPDFTHDNLDKPRWVHRPHESKKAGGRRNLRILTGQLAETPTAYFYVAQEYYFSRHTSSSARENFLRFAKLFLSIPGGDPSMQYQTHLYLAGESDLLSEAAQHALAAFWLFPHREAAAALVQCAFQENDPAKALYWAERLIEIPEQPVDRRLWCHEPRWHGWAGWDLYARALRLNGRSDEARAIMWDKCQGGRFPRFSLLHATRGRPTQAIAARENWLRTADHPERIEHIFAVDQDDEESVQWLRQFGPQVSGEDNCVAAWNLAAKSSRGEVLIQLSDDWLPPHGWDTALNQAIGERDAFADPFVVAVSDGGRGDDLLCMAILSRKRWEDQGKEVFSSEYKSMYSDNEFTHRAYRDDVVIPARHLVFKHQHPAFGTASDDATYQHTNAPDRYHEGLATFKRRNPDAA